MVVIKIFLSENFTFNGKYSKDLGVSIVTFESDIFNEVGLEYKEDIMLEHNLIEYSPYYVQNATEIKDIELNLLVYNPRTMTPIKIEDSNMEDIYDWLITDNFAEFVSDDDREIIYYFKVVSIVKNFSFSREGYLTVTFKPYSKYCYQRKEYNVKVEYECTTEIFNPSKVLYYPIIEVTNLGDESTINKINDMEITGLGTDEKIIIDNLTKLVQTEEYVNKFSCCNRKWIGFNPRVMNTMTFDGNCIVKIIAEFPIVK